MKLSVFAGITLLMQVAVSVESFSLSQNVCINNKKKQNSVLAMTGQQQQQEQQVDDCIIEQSSSSSSSSSPRRRLLLRTSASAVVVAALSQFPLSAQAGIDVSALKNLPIEGDATGAATRLKQLQQQQQAFVEGTMDIPFETLPSGVSFRQYREGTGDAVVGPNSKVAVEMTIRCKSFATANEPGGLKYFSTKDDTDFNELAWTMGSGAVVPPGLEEGMMGMKKNGIRRIELPSTMIFAARNNQQLPLPRTKDGKRRFEAVFKTDATMLFEVKCVRIK